MRTRGCLAVVVSAGLGCAQITATASVRTLPGGRTLEVQRRVVDRQLEARWMQRGDSLMVELVEHRRCQQLERVAVTREATSVRRADAALYVEYGLAAALVGLAAFAFARPELFAVEARDDMGQLARDRKTGLALGGVFMGLGAAALGAGVYDTLRARDRVQRYEAVALQAGPAADCEAPTLPASQRKVELLLGAHRGHGVTDLEGRVHFALPGSEAWPAGETSAEPAIVGLDQGPARRTWKGTLRAGLERDMAIEVVLPYELTASVPQAGVSRTLGP